MTNEPTVNVLHYRDGRLFVLTVQFPDGSTHTDKFDLTKFRKREQFIKDACQGRESLSPADLRDVLEAIVAEEGAAKAAEGAATDGADGSDGSDSIQQGDSSTAALLVGIAQKRYRLGRTEKNEPFAIAIDGPRVVRHLHDTGPTSLRTDLAKEFWRQEKRVANGSALTDALQVLEGLASEGEVENVHLRVAPHGNGIVLDLGDDEGNVIVVTPSGWQVTTESPVLFRRTQLTGRLPMPQQGGSLDELLDMINVSQESKQLVIGYLVGALIPGIKHPILLMGGLKGAGKSTGAEGIGRVIDPGPAMLRTPPRDVEEWALNASSSWVVVIDNVSRISEWWSDALCRAATGDGLVRRRLFTSEQLSVLAFLRVVILTSIDAGALKGDFGDRVLLIDLEPIPRRTRKSETKFWDRYREAHPRILGALLDLMVKVLGVLPSVNPAELERMADFHRVLIAIDQVRGTNGAQVYVGQRTRVAEEVVEGDAVAQAVVAFIQREGEWTGTSKDLLERITPQKTPKSWPETPRALSGCVRRLVGVLGELGIEVIPPAQSNRGGGRDRERLFHLQLIKVEEQETVRTVRPTENGQDDPRNPDSERTVDRGAGADRPTEATLRQAPAPEFGRSDGLDGTAAYCSEDAVEDSAASGPWPKEITGPILLGPAEVHPKDLQPLEDAR